MTERQFHVPKQQIYYQSLTDPNQQIVFDGESYRRCSSPDAGQLVSIALNQYREVARMRLHNREFGDYPWDHWAEWAREDGVSDDFVQLGRSLIREADQHSSPPELQDECGWSDSGAKMIQFALQNPDAARERWERLMEDDGYLDDDTGEWDPSDLP